GLAEPIFDRHSHFLESSFEEVISGFDADKLFGIGEGVDEGFEFTGGAELIARAADEEFRLGASAQKFEIVDAAFDRNSGQAERDERADAVIVVGGARSDGGSERKTGEDDGQRELMFQPVDGSTHVFDFVDAAGVLAFTQAGTAEVEAEHGNPKLLSAFMAWKTTLLCSVPPYSGCGWQTTAACVALGDPALRSASRRPAAP